MAGMNRHLSEMTVAMLEGQIKRIDAQSQANISAAARLEDQIRDLREEVEMNERIKADLKLLIDIAPRKV